MSCCNIVCVCSFGIDKGDVEASRSLLWRLDTAKQVASFNEQKQTAYVHLEYCYLHYMDGGAKGLSSNGLHSSFQHPDSKPFSIVEKFASNDLWPAFLSKASVEYQPVYDMQKRFLATIQYEPFLLLFSCHMHCYVQHRHSYSNQMLHCVTLCTAVPSHV